MTNKNKNIPIEESREMFRNIVQNLSEGIIMTDTKGRITFVNQRMCQLSGYNEKELIGNDAIEVLVPKKERKQIELILEERKQGPQREFVIPGQHKNGAIWQGQVKASSTYDSNQAFNGTLAVVTDITEQLRAEEKVNESKEKLQMIIDTSLDAVITINEKGEVLEWSQHAETIFSYTREEAIGKNMGSLIVPPHHREAHDRGMKHYLKTGEGPVLNKRIEITGYDKNEREFPIELSITSIKLKDRYIFSGFIRDITKRKEAEEELIRAKQAAEQAHMAERQFLAHMSHEIRTPMNAVIGMTHLLYEAEPTEQQKDYLDSLRFSADSLMGILNNILDLSKIEAGELVFESRSFDLLELLQGLQQTFQFKVRDKPVSVVFDFDSKIKNLLTGDATRLNQILTNLLGNASKFTQRGTIGVKAKLVVGNDKQYVIQFQVYDTGIGIDKDKVELIFKNFKQANVEVHRKFGGTGLGLAIVKQLVEIQGGSIEVESKENKGSTFTITLPFENSGIPLSEKPIEQKTEEYPDEILSFIKILVVEDNTMNQKLIKKILEIWGCEYQIAEDGVQAVEMSKNKKYDIVLMDIHMPEMDGVEATIQIKGDAKNINRDTPIIALTAAALLDEKNRALNAGMNDFLTKPFSPSKLKETIMKWTGTIAAHLKSKEEEMNKEQVPTEDLKVDLSSLHKISKGDVNFMKDMIEVFLKEIPMATDKMLEDIKEKDYASICNTAHRIKSNYMMFGMKNQQKMALSIEKMIKTKSIDEQQLPNLLLQLKGDSELVYPILQQKLAEYN